MANPTSNYGWQMPTATDLVTDLPADFAVFGQAVDTSMADLLGGTTGQVLAKASNTNMDFSWVAIDPLVILDAKGDLITATAADTPARLAVGTNGQVLKANSSTATGLEWGGATATTTWTLVGTTTLSGSSTTISGLGAYDNYIFEFNCIVSGFGQVGFKLNGGTGSTLNYAGQLLKNTSATASYHIGDGMNVNGQPNIVIADGFGSGIAVSGFAQVDAASTTSRKFVQVRGDGQDTPANNQQAYNWQGMWNPAATLSSVAFTGNGITLTGTVRTYGA